MAQPEKKFSSRSAKKNRRRKRKTSTNTNKQHMVHGDQGHIIHAMTPRRVTDHSSAVHSASETTATPQDDFVVPVIKPSTMPHFAALNQKDTINNYRRPAADASNHTPTHPTISETPVTSQAAQLSSLLSTELSTQASNEASSRPSPMRFKLKKQLTNSTSHSHPANSHSHPANSHSHPANSHSHPANSHSHPANSHSHPANSHSHPANSHSVTQKEYSAGGLIIRGFREGNATLEVALIGRNDRRGKILWSIPKGHIEEGETAEIAAQREIQEETGLKGYIIAKLGVIHYSFIVNGRKVYKTVHHFLLVYDEGELSADDIEISEVKWVPFEHLLRELTYADEKKLHHKARAILRNVDNSPENISRLILENQRLEPNDYEKAAAKKNLSRFEPIPHRNLPNDSRPPERERYTYSAAKNHTKKPKKNKKSYKNLRNISDNP